jgi:chemotaxis protein CheD
METVVRMGEAAVTASPDDVLACIGLGSCIGLVLIDRGASIAAMAHVMLPASTESEPLQPCKFADLAVPALIAMATEAGALRIRLEAALAGGAAMFSFSAGGGSQEVGARNEAAVRRALHAVGVPVRATVTGGSRGRTVRVTMHPEPTITVREAGGRDEAILGRIGRDQRVTA